MMELNRIAEEGTERHLEPINVIATLEEVQGEAQQVNEMVDDLREKAAFIIRSRARLSQSLAGCTSSSCDEAAVAV